MVQAKEQKRTEGKMGSKDFLGKGRPGLVRREREKRVMREKSGSNAFWKEMDDWRREGLGRGTPSESLQLYFLSLEQRGWNFFD